MEALVADNSILSASGSVCITPPLGTALAGYFTERRAEGVYDDLYSNICIVQQGNGKVVIIGNDIIGTPREIGDRIRNGIAARTEIPAEAILVAGTHTHTGPILEDELADQTYLSDMCAKIIRKAQDLNAELAPCLVEFGTEQEKRYSFNRRYRMKDGTTMTNPGADNADVVGPAGVVDYSLNVVKITDASGKVKAIVVNHGNHADTVYGEVMSADWPGYLTKRLKDEYGDVTVVVLNGTEGDINHFDVMNNRVVQNLDEAKRIGRGYGETAIKACTNAKPLPVDRVGGVFDVVTIPRRIISDEGYAGATDTVEQLKDDPEASLEGKTLEAQHIAKGHPAVKLMFARQIVDAYERRQAGTLGDAELAMDVIRFGELAIVGVGGELFTQIGLDIKAASPFAHTLLVVLALGSAGYVGTRESYQGGGYETMGGERVCDDAEDYVKDTAAGLLGKARVL
jgi:hypothetical protein